MTNGDLIVRQTLIAERYRLLRLVGSGGMGQVWLARDETLQREVAIKEIVPPGWLIDSERVELRARTMREAQTAARLNHPNVVRVYDVVNADDTPWIVMEYVPSRSLYEILKEDGPLDPVRVARIGSAVLAALRAAHRAGVLHRDVKPHNVLIGEDGRVVLTDFGLATFDGDSGLTRSGLLLGSPQYVAPERAMDSVSTAKSDLWSLGATLYTAVEGRSPYDRPTPMATLAALATVPPDPFEKAGPLALVLAGLLRRNPERRLDAAKAERMLRVVVEQPTDPGALPVRTGETVDGSNSPPAAAVVATAGGPGPAGGAGTPGGGDGTPGGGDGTPEGADPDGPRSRRRLLLTAAGVAVALLATAGFAISGDGLGGLRDNAAAGAGTATTAATRLPNAPGRSPGAPGASGPEGPAAGAAKDPVPGPAAPPPGRHEGPGGPPPVGPPPHTCQPPPPPHKLVTPAPVLPAAIPLLNNWTWHVDPAGFRIAAPVGWEHYTIGQVVCFHEPHGPRVLIIDPTTRPTDDPVGYLRAREKELVSGGLLPGYESRGIRTLPLGKGAEWECRWTGLQGERLHTSWTLFTAAPDSAYLVTWHTQEFDWTANLAYLDLIRRSFDG